MAPRRTAGRPAGVLVTCLLLATASRAIRLDIVNRQTLPTCSNPVTTLQCNCPASTASCTNPPTVDSQWVISSTSGQARISAEWLIDSSVLSLVSGSASVVGNSMSVGVLQFNKSCHLLTTSAYGYDTGIVVSTGNFQEVTVMDNDPNSPMSSSYSSGTDSEIQNSTSCSALKFQVKVISAFPLATSLRYVFFSEEYVKYVGKAFNDQFAFFIDDASNTTDDANRPNLALLGDGQAVSIDTVNPYSYSQNFRMCQKNNGFDGNTVDMRAMKYTMYPNKTYNVKLVICNRGDTLYDSAVVLKAKSLTACTEGNPVISCPPAMTICPGTPAPEASAMDGCGPLATERTSPSSDSFTSTPGTYTTTYAVSNYPSTTCQSTTTVSSSGPDVVNRTVYDPDGLINDPTSGYGPGTYTISFALVDYCCDSTITGTINWGDGTPSTSFSATEDVILSFPHNYTSPATSYSVTITATNCNGGSKSTSFPVYVVGTCPNAPSFQYAQDPASQLVNSTFTQMYSIAGSCLSQVVLSLGNGQTITQQCENCIFDLSYSQCGTYTLTATAYDFLGRTATNTKTVTIGGCYVPTPTPSPAAGCTLSQASCQSGFAFNSTQCACLKICSLDTDCILDGVCSGNCLSSGRCEQITCANGCCKATPGSTPGTFSSPPGCAAACGKSSCCVETSANSCNSIPTDTTSNGVPQMVETCSVLYAPGSLTANECTSDSQCPNSNKCLLNISVGKNKFNICSRQCFNSTGCDSTHICQPFTRDPPPAVRIMLCVPKYLVA